MKQSAIFIITVAALMATSCSNSSNAQTADTVVAGTPVTGALTQEAFINAAEQTVNGVVSVKSYATVRAQGISPYGDLYNDPLFEFFFGPQRRPQQRQQPAEQRQTGLGSGVIISTDGYIVTNNHVIADAERLEVTLNDNRNFPAEVIGYDPVTDLALIRIDAPDLHVIPMGDSEQLRLGEWVLAVGNPFGFTSSVTAGIVSAKARNISSSTGSPSSGGIESYIQTDAAVNRGNSGGALVNLRGELVGINTAIYSQTGNYVGCSFAIPTSIVQKVVNDIKRFGAVQRAYLGISFVELTPELVAQRNIDGAVAGILVMDVEDGSSASEAGIASGDVIIELNGRPTLSTAQLQEAVSQLSPGDVVKVVLVRDGKRRSVKVSMRNRRGDTAVTSPNAIESLGCTFKRVDSDLMEDLGINAGVQVDNVSDDGLFARYDIRKGFIITAINNNPIKSIDDIKRAYNNITGSKDRDHVLFITGVYPNGRKSYYAVNLDE